MQENLHRVGIGVTALALRFFEVCDQAIANYRRLAKAAPVGKVRRILTFQARVRRVPRLRWGERKLQR